jgi:uncharacterized protein YeaO (DUF488 family)
VAVASEVRVARVYNPPGPDDGTRVLVDRLWPRGLAKDTAVIDNWCKVVAPSAELRRWFAHDPDRFDEFTARYRAELAEPERAAALAKRRRDIGRHSILTLLTATKPVPISHAAVLAEVVPEHG